MCVYWVGLVIYFFGGVESRVIFFEVLRILIWRISGFGKGREGVNVGKAGR